MPAQQATATNTATARDEDNSHTPTVKREALELRDGVARAVTAQLAEEVPIALVYNGHPHVVMMASPCDLQDFAVGFSLTEGIVGSLDEINDFFTYEVQDGIELHIDIPPQRLVPLQSQQKNLPGRSGCGLCGTQMLADAVRKLPPLHERVRLTSRCIARALLQLTEHQPLHEATGGVHAAVWCDTSGAIVAVREDVGRHNALDKLIGHLARSALLATPGFVLMSSRASYELVQKVVTVDIEVLATVSAPTALAVELAKRANATLIGFAREERLTVYAGAQRVIGS